MGRVQMFFVTIAMGLLIPAGAQAVDLGAALGAVKVNGFISQGYIVSEKNNFFGTTTDGGSYQFNEVGLTAQSQVADNLRVGVQLLSRDLGKDGNNDVKLDWGYGDYHYNDYVGVRLGKVKLPLGLYNEGRDSDILRPMFFLPQSIYDENKRDLLVSYQGAGLYGNLPLGPMGDMDYHGFVGTINFDDDSVFVSSVKQAVTAWVKTGAPANANKNGSLTNFSMENDYITGGTLTFNTALPGLRLGASYLKVSNELSYNAINTTRSSGKGSYNNKGTIVGSLEYSIGDFVLAGEYSELRHRNEIFTGPAQEFTSQGYYGMVSYSPLQKLTLSLLYDVFYANMGDKDGDNFAAQTPAKPDAMGWRKDLGFGVRYDVNPNWTLKAEYHYVDGVSQNMTAYNDFNDLKQYWNYMALKASFNF